MRRFWTSSVSWRPGSEEGITALRGSRNRPLLAIVGRPNVGKSNLFNRICGRNKALVSNVAGTTRDLLYGSFEWMGETIDVVDTGGMFQEKEDFFSECVMEQASLAASEAQMVAMVVDGREPIDEKDRRIARILQRELNKKPVVLVVNKIDSEPMLARVQETMHQKYRNLGLGEPVYVSALHAEGTTELCQIAFKALFPNSIPQDRKAERLKIKELQKAKSAESSINKIEEKPVRPLRIAVVGVPNVGKSSLVNRILGPNEQRSMVSPIPGTTHDTVDTPVNWRGERELVLLDTAGIDRRAKAARASLDRSAVLFAIKTIQSADVNLLVLDATRGVTAHEKRIAGYILDSKSSVIVVVNKSDLLISQSEKVKEEYEAEVRKHLKFMPWVPIVFVSALEGVNVSAVIDLAIQVNVERLVRIPTRKLWELLQRALMRRSAPSKGHLKLRIGFVSQAKTTTPTFVFFVNEPDLVHFSFERFLENAIREVYPFKGSPISILWKKKEGKEKIEKRRK